MIQRLKKSAEEKDQGFTLIELLVVIVIVGILAAIAIPVFLNQRQKAVDAGVESDLKSAATAMETFYTDNQTYVGATVATLESDYGFKLSGDNDVDITTQTVEGFCLTGTNSAASDNKQFIYDSAEGGLEVSAAAAC